MKRLEISKGDRFGRLTIIKEVDKIKKRRAFLCQCDCGSNPKIILLSNLSHNKITSCGCYRLEKVAQAIGKQNKITVAGDVAYITDNNGNTAKIDSEDVERVQKQYFHIKDYKRKYFYSEKVGYLHRFIINVDANMVVDHINRDTTDNRKCNLRACTQADNCTNLSISKANTSGVIGVSKTVNGTYHVKLKRGNIEKSKKVKTFKEAVMLRKQWEKEVSDRFRNNH